MTSERRECTIALFYGSFESPITLSNIEKSDLDINGRFRRLNTIVHEDGWYCDIKDIHGPFVTLLWAGLWT